MCGFEKRGVMLGMDGMNGSETGILRRAHGETRFGKTFGETLGALRHFEGGYEPAGNHELARRVGELRV